MIAVRTVGIAYVVRGDLLFVPQDLLVFTLLHVPLVHLNVHDSVIYVLVSVWTLRELT